MSVFTPKIVRYLIRSAIALLGLFTGISFGAETWKEVPEATVPRLHYLTFIDNTFFAVGDNGTIAISENGIDSWSRRESGTESTLYFITYCGGRFVAVGDAGIIVTSGDGNTWTATETGFPVQLSSVTYGNGTFVAIGTPSDSSSDLFMLTSGDGTVWEAQRPDSISRLFSVAFGNDRFVAVGYSLGAVSTDGSHWEHHHLGTSQYPSNGVRLHFANGYFFAPGLTVMLSPMRQPYMGNIVLVSTDGIGWRAGLTGAYVPFYNGNTFLAVNYTTIVRSSDGTKFDTLCTMERDTAVSPIAIAYGKDRFVLLSSNGRLYSFDYTVSTGTLHDGTSQPPPRSAGSVTVTTKAIVVRLPVLQLHGQYQLALFTLTGKRLLSTSLRHHDGMLILRNPGLTGGSYVLSVMRNKSVVMSRPFTLQ
ncbi:MAG: hypothetical protein JW863_08240 [Chitinispirillaceae bacterium]|nr:hypothetical protein [Chitinispirillaceae bacterium]